MAKGLGMATTAEGVETAEQLEIVRAEGCTEMQGFYFGQPVSADKINALLAQDRGFASGNGLEGRERRVPRAAIETFMCAGNPSVTR